MIVMQLSYKFSDMNKELIRLYKIARLSGCKASVALNQARAWTRLGVRSENIVLIED